MKNRQINKYFVIIISVITVILIALPTGFENPSLTKSTLREKAEILKVDNSDLQTYAVVTSGSQSLTMWFRVPGTVMDFSETLLYSGYTHIKLTDIFLSGIFISAAGAVMDVAMDIAAAQNELIEKKPDMGGRELMFSGFNIAYPVIGTMTTTLLFAYSGGVIFIFMAFMAKGTPIETIFNTNYIAGEILNTLVGSFGLVLVAPATAIIGGYVYTRKSKPVLGNTGKRQSK